MRLDQDTLQQLQSIFASLKHQYTLRAKAPEGDHYGELEQLLGDFASTSPQLSLEMSVGGKLSVEILRDDQPTGITFRAIPSGHEFSSLILAIYNADGQGKNLPDRYASLFICAVTFRSAVPTAPTWCRALT